MKLTRKFWLIFTGLYLLTHLFNLTALPVFADESIYIRWSQLILDDNWRYLFFALNDGKTPLFIWNMVPFLNLFQDPLFAGRLVSVLFGLGQVWLLSKVTWEITKNSTAAALAAVLSAWLPFWFFYQRMALMDIPLTFWLLISFWASVRLTLVKSNRKFNRLNLKWITILAIGFGAALWTKIPAVLFVPTLFLTPGLMGFILSKIHVNGFSN